MGKKSKPNDAMHVARKTYGRPKLTEFGHVGALTQSGTGNGPEMFDDMGVIMGMMPEMMDRP